MTHGVITALATLAFAFACFGAGSLLTRRKAAAPDAVAALRAQLERTRADLTNALHGAESAETALAGFRAEHDRGAAVAKERRHDVEDALFATRQRVAELGEARDRAVSELRHAEAERSAFAQQLDALRDERAELLQRADDAEREARGRVRMSELDELRRELAVLREVHRAKLDELAHAREGNTRMLELETKLAATRNDLAFAKAELARRAAEDSAPELATLRMGLPVAPSTPPSGETPPTSGTGLKGRELQELLQRTTATGKVLDAVVSDETGLVVSGSGVHSDALAASSALLLAVVARAREDLELAELSEVRFSDVLGRVVCVRPFVVRYSTLTFASLSVGDSKDEPSVRQLFFAAPQVAL